MDNEHALKGPVIFGVLLTVGFYLLWMLLPLSIPGLLKGSGAVYFATLVFDFMVWMAGGNADLLCGYTVNGWYLAAFPTAFSASLLMLTITAPLFA